MLMFIVHANVHNTVANFEVEEFEFKKKAPEFREKKFCDGDDLLIT